jgi:hypothetical protein
MLPTRLVGKVVGTVAMAVVFAEAEAADKVYISKVLQNFFLLFSLT